MEVLARLPETAQVALTKPPTYQQKVWGSKRNTGTRLGHLVAGPKRGQRVGNTNLCSGRGCVSSTIDCSLEPPTAARWRERRLKTGSSPTPHPLWGPRDRGNCSFVEVLCTTDREPSSGEKRNRRFSTQPSSGGGAGAFTISRRASSSISRSPVSGPLAFPLAARFGRGLDGRAVWCGPALLEAAAFAA